MNKSHAILKLYYAGNTHNLQRFLFRTKKPEIIVIFYLIFLLRKIQKSGMKRL